MPIPTPNKHVDRQFNRELAIWMKKNGKGPLDLAREIGWSQQHCYRLHKGVDKFGHAALGLFALTYGMDALRDILRMAEEHHE